MGFLRAPKMPAPAPIQMPKVEDVPEVDEEELKDDQEDKLEDLEKKRKGRRSTILTGPRGLTNIDEDNISNKTLLGGK